MNLYFESDIFRGSQAGIYRYSKEIAQRFYRDPSVDCRFVSSSGSSPNVFSGFLPSLFSADVTLYERSSIKDGSDYRVFPQKARDRFDSIKAKKNELPSWCFKLQRELARLSLKRENRLLETSNCKFYFEGERPIVFGPHRVLTPFFDSHQKAFTVQVVYDLIPVLYPEYFDNRSVFDGVYSSLDRNDLIITISESTRKDLLRIRPDLDSEKIFSVPLAASEHFIPVNDIAEIHRVKSKYGIPVDSEYVFTVSTVEPRKNQLRLVQAWSQIYSQLDGTKPKLVIAGSRGWGEDYLKDLHEHDEIDKSVILTGFVDDEDLPALYSGSVITAYPTLYEGFGIPVLESMSCGKFCVTSNNSSIPEIVGPDMPLIDPSSVGCIAEMMLKAFNDVDFRQPLENLCMQRSLEFDWGSTYEKTKKIIQVESDRYFNGR